MANTLLLRLEGPLQAWGERARWDVRDTAPEPTKSGVVGLLACALGMREDEGLRGLSQGLHIGVRCDQPGTYLTDFHTIVGGVMSGGKVRAQTVVSYRSYLCDASFLVAVHGMPDLIDRLALAVQMPVWPIYLGRKSCPPSRPPFEGTGDYQSLQAALEDWPWYHDSGEKQTTVSVRAVLETSPGAGRRLRDEIRSRSHRVYDPRYTRDITMRVRVTSLTELGSARLQPFGGN